jgi:two-component system KDP operon response regulator KdpE
MNRPEILIIDDEPQIRRLLRITLESHEYKVIEAATGQEGITLAAMHAPELILLDIDLPDINGQDVLNQLRQWYVKSIIMLSVIHGEADLVQALDNGATDYLTKPFRTGELLARIRASIRRHQHTDGSPILRTGKLEIDFAARVVKKEGEPVRLTSTEYNLMALFAQNEGRVLTHQHILKQVWGLGYQTETQYLRVFVAQLRKKLEDDPHQPVHIITESGVGYRFS